jgi:hypothetical protein
MGGRLDRVIGTSGDRGIGKPKTQNLDADDTDPEKGRPAESRLSPTSHEIGKGKTQREGTAMRGTAKVERSE